MGAMVQIPTLFVLIPSHRGIGGICSSGFKKTAGTMNKTEFARKIQALDGLSNEEKTALLELIRGHKKYGLVWEEKPEDIEDCLREYLPVLVERNDDKVHPIISDNPDAPNHIIIEGDNLAALTELSYTHAGRVDVIYIDPPYNTGNKDFIYNDSYLKPEDDFRHSTWLSFMKKRLQIALQLLSRRGIVFISIDDNEQANLKILCDEIFGRNNMLATLIWKSKSGGANDSRFFAVDHEYILVYGLMPHIITPFMDNQAEVTTQYNQRDEKGEYSLDRLDKQSIRYSESLDYEIIGPDGKSYYPKHKDPSRPNATWRWSKSTVSERYDELVFKNGNVYTKNYRKESNIARSLLLDDRFGRTRTGKTELAAINPNTEFTAPKPTKLIWHLLNISDSKNSIILDFFAGSGTTLHAVMKMNADDGGHRRCILCQGIETDNNGDDKHICEKETYERNKRVIEGYTKPNGEEIAGLSDNNLRYYRTVFLPRERSVKNMRELVQTSTGLLCIKNDLYTEALFGSRKMNPKYARYFENSDKRMLVIYEEQAIPFIADIIKTMPGGEKIKVYVFSHGSYAYDDEFAEVEDRVELCALPQAIYDAYQKVLPKRNSQLLVDELVEGIETAEATEEQSTHAIGANEAEEGGDK